MIKVKVEAIKGVKYILRTKTANLTVVIILTLKTTLTFYLKQYYPYSNQEQLLQQNIVNVNVILQNRTSIFIFKKLSNFT